MDLRVQENLNGKESNYIAPFLWMHGEDDARILEEIDQLQKSGIRSVCLESRPHPEFCRNGWWDDVRLVLEECKRRGMKVWILDERRYPSGYANGIFVEKYKHLQPWAITETHVDVAGPIREGSVIASGWLEHPDDSFVSVTAHKHIPDSTRLSGEMIDLTGGLSDGMLYFDLPEGMWRIVFTIRTRRGYPNGEFPYCDVLNPETVALYIQEVHQAHYDHFKEYFGNTFQGFFSDEPRFHNFAGVRKYRIVDIGRPFCHYPWGGCVMERLKEEFGDEAEKMLGALWFEIDGVTERFRLAYMDIITDEYRKNYCNQIADWCHAHGALYIGHIIEDNNAHAKTGPGPGHFYRSQDRQDMAGIDVVIHQIMPGLIGCDSMSATAPKHVNNDFYNYTLAKLGASMSHIDPLKKGRAMCEIFAAYGWAEGTKVMKYLMDHMLVRGQNFYVPNGFSMIPYDTDCPPNLRNSGFNPEYSYFKKHMDYLNRTSYVLNDGLHVSTCAVLYDAENYWVMGDFLPIDKITKTLTEHLFDFDIIPSDSLADIREGGVLNGERYNVLLVPFTAYLSEKLKCKLQQAKIRPVIVCRPGDDPAGLPFEWVYLSDLPAYMAEHGYADIRADYTGIYLRYYHYQRAGADIYMFSNEDIHNPVHTTVTLKGFAGGNYIEYDSYENRACIGESADGTVEIDLPPYHTIMILVGDTEFDAIPAKQQWQTVQEIPVETEYTISVAERNSEEFKPYVRTKTLFNITGPGKLPYFSGRMKYEAEFELDSVGHYLLDLGEVGETAELYLNGQPVGSTPIPPYVFDISAVAVPGKNRMTLIVANHNGYEQRDKLSQYMLFEPSGLRGPVVLKKIHPKP